MENVLSTFRERNPNRHNPLVYRLALKCYLQSARQIPALQFYNSMVSQGFQPTTEVMETLIFGLLRHNDELNAKKIFETMGEQNCKKRAASYNSFIRYYLREQQPEKARACFYEMESLGIEANQSTYLEFIVYFISKSDYQAADKIRQFMNNSECLVDVRFFNGMIDAMGKKLALHEIDKLLREMKERHIEYNLPTYNALIRIYASVGNHEKVNALLEEMRKRGINPTTLTFNSLLKSLSSTIKPSDTREILQQMSKLGLNFNGETYAALILNLVKQEKNREAVEMIIELDKRDVTLPVESYGNLIKVCADAKLYPAVRLLCEQMRRQEIPMNSIIYCTLISYYLMRRKYDQVDSLLLEMTRKWNIPANLYIFSTLINHYVEELDFVRIKALIGMMKDQKIEFNAVIYNVIMKAFYAYSRYQQGGHVARMKGFGPEILELENVSTEQISENFDTTLDTKPLNLVKIQLQFEKLFGIPFRPTIHLYNEILLSFFIRQRFEDMFACMQEMRRADIVPNKTTFTFLIKAKIFQGKIEEARELLNEMHKTGQRPTILHCALFFHSYCRKLLTDEANEFLVEMEQVHHIRPNHVFYGSLIYAYTRRREYSSVFTTFEKMEKAGFRPDTETCNYVLISLLEINEFLEAKRFFEKMLLEGIRRNNHTYSYLADGFLARNDDKSLLTILSDCVMPDNIIDAYPFNRVLAYYYLNEKMDEIIKVLLTMNDYSVRYNKESLPFISHVFARHCSDLEMIPSLIKVVQKTLIDIENDVSGIPNKLLESLLMVLHKNGMDAEAEAFKAFLASREEMSKIWTMQNPRLGRFQERENVTPDDYKFMESDDVRQVREVLGKMTSEFTDAAKLYAPNTTDNQSE